MRNTDPAKQFNFAHIQSCTIASLDLKITLFNTFFSIESVFFVVVFLLAV